MVELGASFWAIRSYPLSEFLLTDSGSLLEGEVHGQVLPSFQLLGQKNVSFKVETSTGGRVPGNSRARISFGSGYKGSSPGDISGRMAPPQGGDKSQDKEPGKGALRCTRTLRLSIYHETRCKLEIYKPWD